jgi:hypothetical protein
MLGSRQGSVAKGPAELLPFQTLLPCIFTRSNSIGVKSVSSCIEYKY